MQTSSRSSAVSTRDFIAEPLNLESLVAYQKHSVVSKQILNKKAGTLTLFAFDKGEGLSEHTAPYDASVLILDGKTVPIPFNCSKAEIGASTTTLHQKKNKVVAEIKIGGKPHRLKKGEMIIMPAGLPHSLKAVEPFKMLLIMIRS